MERISREGMLMGVAQVVAYRGTCSRAQVGVVFAVEGRILVTGYNGAPRGVDHCIHESFYWTKNTSPWETPDWLLRLAEVRKLDDGETWYWDGNTASTSPGCTVVEHAERNAIAFAARFGIALGGSDVYCTHAPCLDCARSLLNAGIRSLTYQTPYRITAGSELLASSGIEVIKWETQ